MFVRTALVIASLVLAQTAVAAPKAKNVCAEHTKAMHAMKTADERTAYCKEHADCESNHCMDKMAAHHKSGAKHHAASSTSTPKPATN
jgi:hypothetical protein